MMKSPQQPRRSSRCWGNVVALFCLLLLSGCVFWLLRQSFQDSQTTATGGSLWVRIVHQQWSFFGSRQQQAAAPTTKKTKTTSWSRPESVEQRQRRRELLNAIRGGDAESSLPPVKETTVSQSIQKYAAVDAPGVLNVHVVPHTHDDVGWRKTVEQYFYGWNASIDARGDVQSILSTALEALLQNPARTFTYVESKFLSLWWHQVASAAQRDALRFVLANGHQWTFVNGAWSMHDEACTHYTGMVDSTSTGQAFLKRHLGVVPTIGWQLDPFGHSATQAQLLTHRAGLDALFFGRIDYQDLERRQDEAACEGLWNANPVVNTTESSTVFWGLTGSYRGNYGAPPGGFCFDVLCDDADLLTNMNETARRDRVGMMLLPLLAVQRNQTPPALQNDILLTMGTDFTYRIAERYFGNLDLLMHTIMLGQDWNWWNVSDIFQGQGIHRVNVFYSSPEYYTQRKYQALQQAQQAQPEQPQKGQGQQQGQRRDQVVTTTALAVDTKTDDFFPYSDCPHCFWTGYFTSRTAFKRMERHASGVLQAARQLALLWQAQNVTVTAESHPLWPLQDALGVAQHHDAITGTAKQHVADDYSCRLHAGLQGAAAFVARDIMQPQMLNGTATTPPLQYCGRLNESICEPSTCTDFGTQALYVIVYNPLAQARGWTVRLPVSHNGSYLVERVVVERREVQLPPLPPPPLPPPLFPVQVAQARPILLPRVDPDTLPELYEVEFYAAPLVPLGAVTYRITLQQQEPSPPESPDKKDPQTQPTRQAAKGQPQQPRGDRAPHPLVHFSDDTVQASNGHGLVVTFHRTTGQLQRVVHNQDALNLTLQWGYYLPYDDALDPSDDPRENSGAYIFRPSNQSLQLLAPRPVGASLATFVPTHRGLQVYTSYGAPDDDDEEPWIHQVVRVLQDEPWIEVEYTVGPVPIGPDGRGKEVVSRLTSDEIDNQGVFYTDSNGHAFLQRQRNVRPSWNLTTYEPVAGNYYPVNAAIYMENSEDDAASQAGLALVTDRSRGGASVTDASLEVMVQRRTVADDHRGVDEPLNETAGGMTPYPPYGTATRVGEGVIVRGTHRLLIGNSGNNMAKAARSAMTAVYAQPLVFATAAPINVNASQVVPHPTLSVLGTAAELPPNVVLVTLMPWYDDDHLDYRDNDDDDNPPTENTTLLLLRLAHAYGPSDDPEVLSKPVQVNVAVVLQPRYAVVSVTETTLSGTRTWSDFVANKYNWTLTPNGPPTDWNDDDNNKEEESKDNDDDNDDKNTVVTLQPLDLRTFVVRVKSVSPDEEATQI